MRSPHKHGSHSRAGLCVYDRIQKGRYLLQTPRHPEQERDKAARTILLRPCHIQRNLLEHDGLRTKHDAESFVLSVGGRTCPEKAAMTSRRMQHPCDPSPTRTRHHACGEGAPTDHDERIRKRPMLLHHIAVIVSKEECLGFYK